MTVLADAYREEEINNEKRVLLKLSPKIAPITVAIFPLFNKEGMPEVAKELSSDLHTEFRAFYDAGGSIGKRYRRLDEAGTPFGVTVDHETLENQTVTIRDRDTTNQERININKVKDYIREKILN